MIFTPDYYREFRCRASACPDPCCRAGWQIPIDEKTYEFYLSAIADIEENTEISDGERIFKTRPGGECRYFRSDGLCDIYIKTGGRLCEICEKYPRFFEEYEGFTEAGLSVSCPTAAALILQKTADCYTGLERSSPDPLLQLLADSRRHTSKMIFSERDPDEAAKKLIGFGADLQELIDLKMTDKAGELEFLPMELIPAEEMAAARKYLAENTEALSPEWKPALLAPPKRQGSAVQRKNYLQYLNYRYFLKAINSGNVYAQCAAAVFLYCLAGELPFDYEKNVMTVSRELEHSAENMALLTEMVG